MTNKNVKTSATGWITLGLAGIKIVMSMMNGETPNEQDLVTLGAIVAAGIGLLVAKDNNVTGGTKQQ